MYSNKKNKTSKITYNLITGSLSWSFWQFASLIFLEWRSCHGHTTATSTGRDGVSNPRTLECSSTAYVMVTYSLWCVCGCRTATSITKPHGGLTVFMQAARLPHGFYLTARSLQALRFLNLTLNFFQKPQRRKHASSASQGHRTVAVRWHTVFLLSLVPRKSYGGLTASLRRRHGALTAAVRRTCGSCNNCEGVVRSPPGILAFTSRLLISRIVRSP